MRSLIEGFRAAINGMIDERSRDPLYLRGAANGLLHLAAELERGEEGLESISDPEIQLCFMGLDPERRCLLAERRRRSRHLPDLSRLEGSWRYESNEAIH
jgi:hypothetical protein